VSKKVAAVPNTVDLQAFSVRPATLPGQRDLRIGCIAGPETDVKGAYVLLDSLSTLILAPDCASIRLLAAAASDAFTAAVIERGLRDKVESLGVLNPMELRAWLTSLDLFVLPSLAEGFPNILLEAMATGVPVVASSVGAIPHVMKGGVEVELVAPGDPNSLALALRRLITNPELRRQRGVAGLAAVRARFSLDSGWDQVLVSEYRHLLVESLDPGRAERRD